MAADPLLAREDEQDRFRALLDQVLVRDNGPDEAFLLLVHGLGGLGKSELLERYLAVSTGEHVGDDRFAGAFFSVFVNFERERERHRDDYAPTGPPMWRALDAIYARLETAVSGERTARRAVERNFKEFRELAAEAANAAEVSAPEESAVQQAQAIVGAFASLTALAGPAAAVAGQAASQLANVAGTAVQAEKAARKGRIGSRELAAALRPDEALVEAFTKGLRELSRMTRPVVLLLDTAELLGDTRVPLFDAIRLSGSRCAWAVAMRFDPDTIGEDRVGDLYFHTLPSTRLRVVEPVRFTAEDIIAYLEAVLPAERAAEVDIPAVQRLTRGLPLAVQLVASLLTADVTAEDAVQEISASGDVSEVVLGLARRYLVHVAPPGGAPTDPDLSFILGLALIRDDAADPDLLAALWDVQPGEVAAIRERLARYHDFVLRRSGSLHVEVKHAVQLFLLQPENRATVRDANRRAGELLRRRLHDFGLATVQAQLDSDDWREAATALVWHTLWVDDREGLRLLVHLLLAAVPMSPSFARTLLDTAETFAPAFSDEVRRSLAGLHVVMPASPFLQRVGTVFRSAAGAAPMMSIESVRSARDALAQAEAYSRPVLATDIDPAVLHTVLRAQHPTGFGVASAADRLALLESVEASLPPLPSAPDLDATVAEISLMISRVAMPTGRGAADAALALRGAELAVRRAPDNAHAWDRLRHMASLRGHWSANERACRELIRLHPDNAINWHNLGVALERQAKLVDALDAHRRFTEREPNGAVGHRAMSYLLWRLGSFDDALTAAETCLTIDDGDARAHRCRGLALLRLGREAEAITAYQRARELVPDDPQLVITLADDLIWGHRPDASLAMVDSLLEGSPALVQAHLVRAMALRSLGRQAEALAVNTHAIGLDPDNAACHRGLAMALRAVGRLADALIEADIAIDMDPNAAAHNTRALVLGSLDRYPEAAEALSKATELEPANLTYHNNLGEALLLSGRVDEAVAHLREAIQLGPTDALEAWVLLAVALADDDPRTSAEATSAALAQRVPGIARFREGELRAIAHLLRGDAAAARAALREVADRWAPSDPFQRRLYDRLRAIDVPGADVDGLLELWPKQGRGSA